MKTNILTEYKDMRKELRCIHDQINRLDYELKHCPSKEAERRLANLRDKYTSMYEELTMRQTEIEDIIKDLDLDPIERDLIRYRYFDGLRWEKVFIKLSYSQRQTFRIHTRIIKKLKKVER